jgi:hypothetical protein
MTNPRPIRSRALSDVRFGARHRMFTNRSQSPRANLHEPSAKRTALKSPACGALNCNVAKPPRHVRDRCVNARRTLGSLLSEPSRSESRDLVCRPMRLSISSFRLLLAFARQHSLACSLCVWPAPPTSGSQPLGAKLFSSSDLRSGPSGRRGTLVSGRFRERTLVGSGRHSKPFLPDQQCFFAGA